MAGAVGGDPLVIVEGEADALASVWLHPGAEVWAAGRWWCNGTGPGHSHRAARCDRSGPGRPRTRCGPEIGQGARRAG